MRNSARNAANYKELRILATNMEEIILLQIISTKKKKYVLMKILERTEHEIYSNLHQFVKDLDSFQVYEHVCSYYELSFFLYF